MIRILESVRIVAPLGLRLWSESLGRGVSKGLAVTLSDPTGRYRPIPLEPNGAGVFVAHRLPGVSPLDLLAQDWPALARPMRLDVEDRSGAHLPFTAMVLLPRAGLLTLAALELGSPPGPADGPIPLFPSPAFTGASHLAAIRVELAHADGRPAAWALVEAEVAGRRHRGVTDSRGIGLIAFPWPQPPRQRLPGSPPEFTGPSWPVTLSAYARGLEAGRPPDLAALLGQRLDPPFRLAGTRSPPDSPALAFGRTLELPPATLVPA